MKQGALPTARLEARLPHDVMARLKRAAEIQGRTLTDFVVVAAADEAACRAIQDTEIIRLSIEGQRQIAAPSLPNFSAPLYCPEELVMSSTGFPFHVSAHLRPVFFGAFSSVQYFLGCRDLRMRFTP